MHQDSLNNINILNEELLITPQQLKEKLFLDNENTKFIQQSRQEISNIIHKKDPRLLVICGPCSIHDPLAAIDYARRLKKLAAKYKDTMLIVMRAYFEKPRTTVGWKGLINDPYINGSFDIEHGLYTARKLLLDLTKLKIPLATEALDPISPQYISDLFSWSAIGARTTESQTHREMASGLSTPVGFKNGTDGNLDVAVNALKAAANSHHFMGISHDGKVALLTTHGNKNGHVILRGGNRANYDSVSVFECENILKQKNMMPTIMIDCSHSNSFKDYTRQPLVAKDVVNQIVSGNKSIIGVMLESFIQSGKQKVNLSANIEEYGKSITDACISWDMTSNLFGEINELLEQALPNRFKKG